MTTSRLRMLAGLAPLLLVARAALAADNAPAAEHVEFFEKHVRPVLVEKCIECHGAKKQQGGLRLDSREAALKGNESGAAMVPGNPQGSRLVQVLAHSKDDVQMPPQGKLPAEQIAAITKWVELGAPWPATPLAVTAPPSAADPASHWSFQPIRNPAVPPVKAAARVQDPLDAFVLAALEAAELSLAPPADRATFIRRATLDLWGLPPTYDEVQAFVADPHPDAVARLIDRLLDSPRYGERWARHWLDIARYADTKGYVFTAEPRYPYSYTYRDYVIDAFNQDKPFDRFVTEQLAADQLDLGGDVESLAALGFLTVGRRFLNNQHDIIDDRIDVVARGLLGLTVGCARCHDHKYDPIPTADYYSLYGVFASCSEPEELPIIGTPKAKAEFEKYQAELTRRQEALAKYETEARDKLIGEARQRVGSYLELVALPNGADPARAARALVSGEPRPQLVRRWQEYLNERAKQPDPVFGPWRTLKSVPAEQFAAAANTWLEQALQPGKFDDGPERVNLLVRQALLERPPTSNSELAHRYGELFAEIDAHWTRYKAAHPEAAALPDAHAEELRQVLYAEESPLNVSPADATKLYNRAERDQRQKFERDIQALQASSPGAPPRAMVLRDNPQPFAPRIFIRGNQDRRGDEVPRQFLKVVAGPERKPFTQGSGRLELAQAIVDPRNPLTARVFVNRVWQHHFGRGLVRSAGDFGVRGEAPTHPELLDHLATRFRQSGWSVKQLHRWIMTSAVYGQGGGDHPAARAVDPDNRLWWKMPRQRLELEAMRDSWLAVSGRLDSVVGGRPFDSLTDPRGNRRTIYGLVNRNDLPGVFRAFDFADPDASAPERPQTTVPQQALFALNAPFVIEQAKQTALETAAAGGEADRVQALYRRVLARDPTSDERELALAFVRLPSSPGKLSGWEKLAQVLLLTNEFLFVD